MKNALLKVNLILSTPWIGSFSGLSSKISDNISWMLHHNFAKSAQNTFFLPIITFMVGMDKVRYQI